MHKSSDLGYAAVAVRKIAAARAESAVLAAVAFKRAPALYAVKTADVLFSHFVAVSPPPDSPAAVIAEGFGPALGGIGQRLTAVFA